MAQLSLWQLCIAGLSCLRPGRWEGAGRSEVRAQQARGYITAPLRHASYHAGVRLGSEGRDFALRAGRGPDIWLDKSSSVYQTGKQKGEGARGEESGWQKRRPDAHQLNQSVSGQFLQTAASAGRGS